MDATRQHPGATCHQSTESCVKKSVLAKACTVTFSDTARAWVVGHAQCIYSKYHYISTTRSNIHHDMAAMCPAEF
jgi:hypothetical protein